MGNPKLSRGARRQQGGYTLIEITIAAAVFGVLAVGVGTSVIAYGDRVEDKTLAEHAKVIERAALKYLNANPSTVSAVATPTTPAVITTSALAPYLPSGFVALNSYGQNAEVRVKEPAPGRLQSVLFTVGGNPIEDVRLDRIADEIGVMGGYIASSDAATAKGNGGAWSIPLAGWGAAPGAGHIAINLAMASDTGCVAPDPLITTDTSCPVGQTGVRTFTDTATCPSGTGVVQWTGPVLTGNTCAPSAPPPPADCSVIAGTTRNWSASGLSCTAAVSAWKSVVSGNFLRFTDPTPGNTGVADYTCTNGILSATPNFGATCSAPAATCVVPSPSTQTQTLSCPSGQYGLITQTQTASCPTSTGPVAWSSWTTTSNTCTACPASTTETRWVSTTRGTCPAGQSGVITREAKQTRTKSYSCPAGTTSLPAPSYTAWTNTGETREVSNTCAATCAAPAPTSAATTRALANENGSINDCSAGAWGSHTRTRTVSENGTLTTSWTCPGPTSSTSTAWLGTFSFGSWVTTGGSCTACPASTTSVAKQWVPWTDGTCPAGQTGTIKREKEQSFTTVTSYSCPAGTTTLPAPTLTNTPNWWADTGNWRVVSNTCAAAAGKWVTLDSWSDNCCQFGSPSTVGEHAQWSYKNPDRSGAVHFSCESSSGGNCTTTKEGSALQGDYLGNKGPYPPGVTCWVGEWEDYRLEQFFAQTNDFRSEGFSIECK